MIYNNRYGFLLNGYKDSIEFYGESKLKRDEWIDHLKSVCVLPNLKSKYILGEKIGCGSFGKVYIGKRIVDDKLFAIKSINKSNLCKVYRNVRCLMKEIQIMRFLNHPNIVKLHEVYETNIHIHLVMEYIEGKNLFQHLQRKTSYNEKDASLIIMQVLIGLDYFHSKGIIHRDIKPDNLMIGYLLIRK